MYNRKYIYIYPAESVLVLLSMTGKISWIREIPETLVLSLWKKIIVELYVITQLMLSMTMHACLEFVVS